MHEQTRLEHAAQRDLVLRSTLLADTRAERHGVYAKRPARVPPKHRYVVPKVVEKL